MKIGEALQSVQRLYVDSAPLIYYVEENAAYIAKMDQIIELIDDDALLAVTSVIILPEVLAQPVRLGRPEIEQAYRDILLNSKQIRLISVSRAIAEKAIDLRARYNLRTADALHIATAIRGKCEAFLTNDFGLKRVTEISILVLDELEL